MNLDSLRALNPALDIRPVTDSTFAPYGRIVSDDGIPALVDYLKENTPIPEGSQYVANDPEAEKLPVYDSLRRRWFGMQDIQIGWCNGTNLKLNALEYHASIEINIAAGDTVLLLARLCECRNGTLDTRAVRGFYLASGQAVALESSTLHFAPCAVDDEGFRVAIVLPRGTNTALEARDAADQPLWMVNKWLLAHHDASHLVDAGAFIGLTGEFLTLKRG